VDVSVPKVVKYNRDDIQANPPYPKSVLAIIVTSKGFQCGALKISEFDGINCQVVNHEAPYGFRYENIVQHLLTDDTELSVSAIANVIRHGREIVEKPEPMSKKREN